MNTSDPSITDVHDTNGYTKKDIYRYMEIWIYTNMSIDILIRTLYLIYIYISYIYIYIYR